MEEVFNRIISLEYEAQKEIEDLIAMKKNHKKWFEGLEGNIIGYLLEKNKELRVNDIEELRPFVEQVLKEV